MNTQAPAIVSSILKYKVTRFLGTHDRIVMPHNAAYSFQRTNPFSMSCWFKSTSVNFGILMGKTQGIVAGANIRGYDYYLTPNGRVGWNLNTNFQAGVGTWAEIQTTAGGYNDGRWHHVVVTTDGTGTAGGMAIYVDGAAPVTQINRDNLGATILNAATLTIGDQSVNLSGPFEGLMHDHAVWNVALSASDVTAVYNSHCPPDLTVVGPTANLVGYWLCGEHKGDVNLAAEATSFPTVPDASANANAGTMTLMTAAAVETRR